MITKGLITSVDEVGVRCKVRLPLFESPSSSAPVIQEAVINIPPGFYSSIQLNDVVFIAFEEDALEKPVILGKLFTGADTEAEIPGGAGVLDTLTVRNSASIPCASLFEYPEELQSNYKNLDTPKNMADYIKWLEVLTKQLAEQFNDNFVCLKNWTEYQLESENVEVDDGDIDIKNYKTIKPYQFQNEGKLCRVCTDHSCTKQFKRNYVKPDTTKNYPKI